MQIKHFLSLKGWSTSQLQDLLTQANQFSKKPYNECMKNHSMATLMFEASTRTENSFSLAAMNLGAKVLSPNLSRSSIKKGESDIDTAITFAAMGINILALRHPEVGFASKVAERIKNFPTKIINAGDGSGEHPSQALLDLLTIYNKFGSNWPQLQVSIVGDCRRSRVANSLIPALQKMGVRKINLVAPKELSPKQKTNNYKYFTSLKDGIINSDIIYVLRIQKEREKIIGFSQTEYIKNYCLNESILKYTKENMIIMHPGPVNENIEISSEVCNSKHSLIKEQIKHGVWMRCAILQNMANNE